MVDRVMARVDKKVVRRFTAKAVVGILAGFDIAPRSRRGRDLFNKLRGPVEQTAKKPSTIQKAIEVSQDLGLPSKTPARIIRRACVMAALSEMNNLYGLD